LGSYESHGNNYRKQKTKKAEASKVGHLSAAQLQLNLESTVMTGHYRSYDTPNATKSDAAQFGKGMAIPLCYPNDMLWDQKLQKCSRLEGVERNTLLLNPDAVKILRSISGPVCIITIVGPCRSGKSYMLSRLISSVGETCHFHLGHNMDPKTMGIWMWDQPFKMKLKNFEDHVTIILLDTEGIDAANATDQGDSQIFTLSVLLSSLMIYNSMNVPKREDLNKMQYPKVIPPYMCMILLIWFDFDLYKIVSALWLISPRAYKYRQVNLQLEKKE